MDSIGLLHRKGCSEIIALAVDSEIEHRPALLMLNISELTKVMILDLVDLNDHAVHNFALLIPCMQCIFGLHYICYSVIMHLSTE